MAIKIRCSDCTKKISIDEAFAGGMCRCPYCKALVFVPEEPGKAGASARPAAPGFRPTAPVSRPEAPALRPAALGARPERPDAAAALAAASAASQVSADQLTAAELERIPLARPVKIQGIITLVLLGLLVVMVGTAITLVVIYIPSRENGLRPPPPPPPPPPDPWEDIGVKGKVDKAGKADLADRPGIAGVIELAGPVIYVMDGGSSMRGGFDYARALVSNSIVSLTAKGQFTILLCREDGDKFLGDAFQAGGEKGREAAIGFMETVTPTGATDVPRALKAALARKPKAIVLLGRKVVDEAVDVAKEAAQQGVVIHTVYFGGDPEVQRSMAAVAAAAKGRSAEVTTPDF